MMGEEYFEGFSSREESKTMPRNLAKLEEIVKNCTLCTLHKTRTNAVFGKGNFNSDLMIIGEAPGRQEDLKGEPFIGKSGKLLTTMLQKILLLSREELYITNIVKCRPPNNRDPLKEEIETCKNYLLKEIEIVNPKIIATMGRIAFQALLNESTPISKARGKLFYFNGIKVVPLYHPSYLLRNPSKIAETEQDLIFIKELL
jgi:DNA polymerase